MKKAIILMVFVIATAFSILPSTVYANELRAASDDDGGIPLIYITDDNMGNLDIGMSFASCNSLPFSIICGAYQRIEDAETKIYDDFLNVDVYLKKPGKKFKKIKSFTMDEDAYFDQNEATGYDFDNDDDEDDELYYDFMIRNLKPSTKYVVKVNCRSEKLNIKRSVTRTFRTSAKPLTKKQIRKSGNSYSWNKAKKATGYIVHYKKAVYLGKNEYGTRMYKWRYAAKTVKKARISLESGAVPIRVIPYEKRGKYIYADKFNIYKSLKTLTKKFKYDDEDVFYD